jgi:hypothetical protein
MDEPLEKNFVQEMRDALQKQLSEFEKEKRDARIVADDGARRWREMKDSLRRLVEEINDGFPEGMLSFPVPQTANDNEFILMHELNKRTMQVTFDPVSAVISYQGDSGKGAFRPRVEGDALEYGWENTTPSTPWGVARPRRAIAWEDDKPPRTFSTKEMSEIIVRCIVVEPARGD